MNDRLTELQRLISEANTAYYTDGTAIMEDERYDALREELRRLNPNDPLLASVGAEVREGMLEKRAHTIPMGSQSKVTSPEEWASWLANNIGDPQAIFHASYKADGGSCSFEYQNGRLVAAITRGDGTTGEDITANSHNFQNLPQTCKLSGGRPFNGFVRGELILNNTDWAIVDPEQASNPRNLVVGIARRKDGSEAEYVRVLAFRLFDADGRPLTSTEAERDQVLKAMGFEVTPSVTGTAQQIWAWYPDVQIKRSKLDFWIDGVVVALNDIPKQLELGVTSGRPRGQTAIKFQAQGANSVLRKCTAAVEASGAIVPVAEFDPVQIGGTTVTNATLANWRNVRTLGVHLGDTIRIIKAGDIIPRIMEVVAPGENRQPILEPSHCPVCHQPAGRRTNVSGAESAILYCFNESCASRAPGKLARYATSLKILGAGDGLIEALVDSKLAADVADLYALHQNRDQLANLMLRGKTRLGERRADKFLAEIEAKRSLTVSELLGSLGIFGLGKRVVILVQKAAPNEFDSLEDWFSDKLVCMATQISMPNKAQRIQADLLALKPLADKCLANGLQITKPAPKAEPKPGAFLICITGKLSKPKDHFAKLIEAAGHHFTDDFSKSVTHLVAADPNSGSAKLKKAAKQGAKVLSEEQFLELLGSN